MSIMIKCQKTEDFIYVFVVDIISFEFKHVIWERKEGFLNIHNIKDNPYFFTDKPSFISVKFETSDIITKLREYSYQMVFTTPYKLRTPTCIVKGIFSKSLFIPCLGKTREHETFKEWSHYVDDVKLGSLFLEGYVVDDSSKMMEYFSGKKLNICKKYNPSISKETLKFFISQLFDSQCNGHVDDKIEITYKDKTIIL